VGLNEIDSYILPEDKRQYFKQPLGVLHRTEEEIKQVIETFKGNTSIPRIISVGDVTTHLLIDNLLIPDLAIIDDRVQRMESKIVALDSFKVEEVQNPAGTITKDSWEKIHNSLEIYENKIIIKIAGEEDLLVLPVILEAPLNSKVLYGQPNEGLVVVTVTEEIKDKVQRLLLKMVKIDEN
jgi:uncharacterized protein (UPF0218 family)